MRWRWWGSGWCLASWLGFSLWSGRQLFYVDLINVNPFRSIGGGQHVVGQRTWCKGAYSTATNNAIAFTRGAALGRPPRGCVSSRTERGRRRAYLLPASLLFRVEEEVWCGLHLDLPTARSKSTTYITDVGGGYGRPPHPGAAADGGRPA